MTKKLQWFKFYPKDFMDDEAVKSMDYEAIGLYWVMLCHCWTNDSMPSDHKKLQRIFNVSHHKFKKLWDQINAKFFEKDLRYFNNRILEEKNRLIKDFERNSSNGKKGAEIRWGGHDKGYSQDVSDATIRPMQDTDTDTDTDIDIETEVDEEKDNNSLTAGFENTKPKEPEIDVTAIHRILMYFSTEIRFTTSNSANIHFIELALKAGILEQNIVLAMKNYITRKTIDNDEKKFWLGAKKFFDPDHINFCLSNKYLAQKKTEEQESEDQLDLKLREIVERKKRENAERSRSR